MAIHKGLLFLCAIGIFGVLSLITGCLLIHFQPIIIHNGIEDNVKISPDSAAWDNWKHAKTPIYLQVWLFNVNNSEEVLKGGQPSLIEKGPYTYREQRHKFNISFTKNDTVKFKETKNYFFVPEMSDGLENDTVTVINTPLLAVVDFAKDSGPFVEKALNGLISSTGEPMFMTKTVHEVLWGYEDKFMEYVEDLAKTFHVPFNAPATLGLLQNGTDDGVYEIYTGKGNIDKVGSIASWKGKDHLDYWTSDIANMINGSDGTTYAPFVEMDATKYIFSSDLCRSIGMNYTETVKNRGITMYRYVAPEILFANVSVNPDNAGFCTPNDTCLPSGLLNVSNCRSGAPVVMSMPHFLGCDQDIIDSVKGLSPNQTEHESYMDVEPNTGVVMKVAKRLQINVHLTAVKNYPVTGNVPTLYLPIIWINESALIDKKSAEDFKDGLFGKMDILKGVKYAFIGLGGFLMLVVVGLLAFTKFRTTIKYSRFGVNTDESNEIIT